MANILFVSNNKAHFPLSVTSTTAGTFDSARVPYAIELGYHEAMTGPVFTPTTGDNTWFHFRIFFDTVQALERDSLLQGYDVNSNLLFNITKVYNSTDLTFDMVMYTTAGQEGTVSTIPFNIGKVNQVDVRYEKAAAQTSLYLYVNGGLSAQIVDPVVVTTGHPVYFAVECPFAIDDTPGPAGTMNFSEFIVADADTRNARLDLLRPVATGGESDWVGAAANLADDDPTTGITSIAANERQTLTLGAYTGASNISAVVVATQSVAGANGPQNLRHTVRLSALNYDGPADFPMGDTLQFNVTDFQTNPATSLPWVGSDLATMEMGFISKV